MTLNPGDDSRGAVRSLCGDLSALVRAVGFRDLDGDLSCVMAFGSDAWDRLFGPPRPAELHPFREIRAGSRHAVSTPGDLLFHIRAKRMDLCFELATQIMARLGDAVSPVDEVHGFRYFDDRDLIGFVDGTENPTGQAGDRRHAHRRRGRRRSPAAAMSSCRNTCTIWPAGMRCPPRRRSASSAAPSCPTSSWTTRSSRRSAHSALTVIEEDGQEIKILRDNMPFGQAAQGEFGTYFIGYSRSPRTIEQMLENMFVGRPPGNYDRLLDFSRAVTGNLFFVPSATFLEDVGDDARRSDAAARRLAAAAATARDGSLGIGSLKGDRQHE